MALGYFKNGAWVGVADESQALPVGGAADEVLVKQTGTDYDAGWGLRAEPWTPRSDVFYGPMGNTSSSFGVGQCFFVPIYFPVATTIDGIRLHVITGGAAGAVYRVGLYASGTGGGPGDLLIDAGTIDTTSSGVKILTITPTTVAGLCWAAAACQVATALMRASNGLGFDSFGGNAAATTDSNRRYYPQQQGVTGALPATANPGAVNDNPPTILLRVE